MDNSSTEIQIEEPIDKTSTHRFRNLVAQIVYFKEIDSTNSFLKQKAQKDAAEEGLCIVASRQTAGRGRMDRTWHSPEEGLYFSILLKPNLALNFVSLITLMAAVATAESVEAFSHSPVDIKWPNDIIIERRKVSGILTEATFEKQKLGYVVVGIGVNLNQKTFPKELASQATSLYLESGQVIDREAFLLYLISRIDHWYGVLLTAPSAIVQRWQQLSTYAYGKEIFVEIDAKKVAVKTSGVEASGALRVETADGKVHILYGGEVLEGR
ncbi:MAG: biotin--[acetyl-CoA-carboxylase] ligase [Blastocatellia bacterium]|nr:biotin--[acetyl-CoA-carboxylase] ligase [Blastocatellia bacterium]